jgi:hypothetical protein
VIPAFASGNAGEERRRAEAWLLIYEILDQSNHAALGMGIAPEDVLIDVLADRFVAFVRRSGRVAGA